jgi:hypothetical protein
MVIVLFCSFLKKNKLVIKKKGTARLFATRTSCVYNICSTLRFPVTDDSLFYNSLPRLLPSGKITKIFVNLIFVTRFCLDLFMIWNSWCGNTSKPQPQQQRRCIVAQPCRLADWSPWETLQQGCRGDDDQVTCAFSFYNTQSQMENPWENLTFTIYLFIVLLFDCLVRLRLCYNFVSI